MRVLAVDYGERRIGVAMSDALEITANPLVVLQRTGGLAPIFAEIGRIVAREGAEEVVVGVPLNFDRSRGPSALAAEEFAKGLAATLSVPVHTHDEYLTTADADERLRAKEKDPRRRRKMIDMVAAAMILESYLAARRQRGRG